MDLIKKEETKCKMLQEQLAHERVLFDELLLRLRELQGKEVETEMATQQLANLVKLERIVREDREYLMCFLQGWKANLLERTAQRLGGLGLGDDVMWRAEYKSIGNCLVSADQVTNFSYFLFHFYVYPRRSISLDIEFPFTQQRTNNLLFNAQINQPRLLLLLLPPARASPLSRPKRRTTPSPVSSSSAVLWSAGACTCWNLWREWA